MSSNINWEACKVAPNSYVSAAPFNNLVNLVRSLVIADAPSYRIIRNLTGTKLDVNFPPTPPTQSYPVTYHPFQAIPACSGSSFIVDIVMGSTNNVVPTLNGGSTMSVNTVSNSLSIASDTMCVYSKDTWSSGSYVSGDIEYTDTDGAPTDSLDPTNSGTTYNILFYTSCSMFSGSIAEMTVAGNVLGSQYGFICGEGVDYHIH